MPLVDILPRFRQFGGVPGARFSLKFLFPLLQQLLAEFSFYSLHYSPYGSVMQRFGTHTSNSLLQVADLFRWQREQGFPVQKINIVQSWIE